MRGRQDESGCRACISPPRRIAALLFLFSSAVMASRGPHTYTHSQMHGIVQAKQKPVLAFPELRTLRPPRQSHAPLRTTTLARNHVLYSKYITRLFQFRRVTNADSYHSPELWHEDTVRERLIFRTAGVCVTTEATQLPAEQQNADLPLPEVAPHLAVEKSRTGSVLSGRDFFLHHTLGRSTVSLLI